MVEEQRRFSIRNLFRRKTPRPQDRQVFNPGIQEKSHTYMMTSPVLYHVAQQSVIVRTCTNQLKNEYLEGAINGKKNSLLSVKIVVKNINHL